jgi:hypothetical protein
MRNKAICASLLAGAMLSGVILMPIAASAQSRRAIHHRQQTKNEWRNIAIGAGALGVLGALNHDSTLAFAGTAGALYSASRYDHDRKSENHMERARAEYFHRSYFYRNGHRYNRKTIWKHGTRYYQFVRG